MYKGNKKRVRTPVAQKHEEDSSNRDLYVALFNIQDKLNNSPVFNGGFDTMLLKIESIEKTQQQTLEQVAELNKTIYEPDEGLFSRIKTVNQEVHELAQWKKSVDEKTKEYDTAADHVKDLLEWKETIDERLDTQESFAEDVKSIKSWKGNFNKVLWWLLPAIGGLLLKTGWEFWIAHVVLK